MLIIGHRGAAGEALENTIEAIERGIADGADMIEFDVRVTRDGVPMLSHGKRFSPQGRKELPHNFTYNELVAKAENEDLRKPETLDAALAACVDRVYVDIDIKTAAQIDAILKVVKKHYPNKRKQAGEILFSSHLPKALLKIRTAWPHATLAMYHSANPNLFMAWHKRLQLSAVGFPRFHSKFSIIVAQKMGLFTYVYSVDRPDAMRRLADAGVDAIVTNHPARMVKAAKSL